MATLTPLLSLVKPAGADAADIAVINGNMNILDNAVTLTGLQTITQKTLTAPHMTGAVVDAGGLTITSGGEVITAGGLTVSAGNVGIGNAPAPNVGIYMPAALVLSGGTTQVGFWSAPTSDTGATTELVGFYAQPSTAAAAFTAAIVAGFHAKNHIKGAGSTITSALGLLVDGLDKGNVNNIGIDIGTSSGGSGLNLSLRASGGVRLSGLGGRVAGDVYVIVDANGDLHKSAIGPAS